MMEMGWRDQEVLGERLYDTLFDPSETNNLAGRPEMAGTLRNMRARLDQWMVSTGDPLIDQGFVAPDDGAVVNDPGDLSPSKNPTRPA